MERSAMTDAHVAFRHCTANGLKLDFASLALCAVKKGFNRKGRKEKTSVFYPFPVYTAFHSGFCSHPKI